MEPSSLVKVTGAFAAGVVLALGGALIYVKTAAAPAHTVQPLVIQPARNPPAAPQAPPPPAQQVQQVETKPPAVFHRVPRARKRLTLAVRRVRGRPPPRRLDRAAAVGRHDEVDPFFAETFPQLPPRGRAAVAKVEIDGGRDGEDPGGAHA